MKSSWPVFLTGLGLLLVVAAVSAYLTARFTRPHAKPDAADYHAWVHSELGLSAKQEVAMAPMEKRYEEKRRHLLEVIRLANLELSTALQEDRADSPRIRAALDRIQSAVEELQAATLEHVFEMREYLESAQYDRLIDLTSEALQRQATTSDQ